MGGLTTTKYVCSGCDATAVGDPYRCPNANAGDDIDHVLTRVMDLTSVSWPAPVADLSTVNPFVHYGPLLHAYHVAASQGVDDAGWRALVEKLDAAVAAVDGHGFRVTPLSSSAALAERLGVASGGVWVKDETGNVGGSHKARHLMGILLYLTAQAKGVKLTRTNGTSGKALAIASCGNAALAAAVVARAAGRRLEVFIPTDADPVVTARLVELGAILNVCPRLVGQRGDPCHHAMRRAVAAGALPFTCQGSDNGLTIDGGRTIGYEMVSQLAQAGCTLDRLFIQVGGGALASACFQSFRDAAGLRVLGRLPRLHAVQTRGTAPLRRAYERVTERVLSRVTVPRPREELNDVQRAELIRRHASSEAIEAALEHAAAHRSEYMWPWEETSHSVAHGILDDETYDWLAILRGMLVTGGHPINASEETLIEAQQLAKSATGIPVDATGTAGLAGALVLARQWQLRPDEQLGVIFSGVER